MNIVCLLTWEGLSIRKLCPGIAFLIVYRQPVKIFIRKKEKKLREKSDKNGQPTKCEISDGYEQHFKVLRDETRNIKWQTSCDNICW